MIDASMLKPFSETLETIYAAALDPTKWSQAAVSIAKLYDSDKAVLFAIRRQLDEAGFIFTAGIAEQHVALWDGRYAPDDIWTQSAIRQGLAREGQIMTNEDLVSEEEFLASKYYLEFLSLQNVAKMLCGCIFDGSRPHLPMSVCTVLRARTDPPFSDRDRQMHQLVTNHLSKAMGTMFRLGDADMQIASNLEALQRLPGAILLLGADGSVQFANAAAEAVFRANDGLELKASPNAGLGHLKAKTQTGQRRLDAMITTALNEVSVRSIDHFSRGLAIGKSAGEGDYVLQFAPLANANEYSRGGKDIRAIVFIADTAASQFSLDDELLSKLYALTPTELRVAQEMIRTEGSPDIAVRMNLSVTTVRSHLKSIFAKTQTQNQSQLLKLLLSFRKMTG